MNELTQNIDRIKEVSEALKVADEAHKKALEEILDGLMDTQDMLIESKK